MIFRERINCSSDSGKGSEKSVKVSNDWVPRKNLSSGLMISSQFRDEGVDWSEDVNRVFWYGKLKDDGDDSDS